MGALELALLVCSVCWQLRPASGQVPAIVSASPDREESVGGNVELSCVVQNLGDHRLQWFKIDNERAREPVILFVSEMAVVPDRRFSTHVEAGRGVHTLRVRNVTDADAGFYRCAVALSLNKQLFREMRLRVKYPPVIYENSTASTVIVPLNGSAKLQCFVAGHPQPKVVWSREDGTPLPTGQLTYTGDVLRLPSVGRQHAGLYRCSADNEVGAAVTKAIRLLVEYPPQVVVARPKIGQALHFDARLECQVAAEPAALVVWKVNGSQVPSNQHYSVAYHATAADYNASVLHLHDVQHFQYGVYTCEATNKYGRGQATVHFYETSEPDCEPTCGCHFWYADRRLVATASSLVLAFALLGHW